MNILFPSHAGSAYEMGYAHGELMSERAQGMVNDVWNYLEEQVVGSESPVPLFLRYVKFRSTMKRVRLNLDSLVFLCLQMTSSKKNLLTVSVGSLKIESRILPKSSAERVADLLPTKRCLRLKIIHESYVSMTFNYLVLCIANCRKRLSMGLCQYSRSGS